MSKSGITGNLLRKQWEQSETVRLLKGAPGTQYQEADETQQAIFRDWVRNLLQQQPVTVTFVKADNTERVMRCTLNGHYIPAEAWPTPKPSAPKTAASDWPTALMDAIQDVKPKREQSPHSIRVWDLDLGQWRSFRFDRLKKVAAELQFT